MVFGFVENKGNEFGFDLEYHIRGFGFDVSFWSGPKRNKSGCFCRGSDNFEISEVLNSGRR